MRVSRKKMIKIKTDKVINVTYGLKINVKVVQSNKEGQLKRMEEQMNKEMYEQVVNTDGRQTEECGKSENSTKDINKSEEAKRGFKRKNTRYRRGEQIISS